MKSILLTCLVLSLVGCGKLDEDTSARDNITWTLTGFGSSMADIDMNGTRCIAMRAGNGIALDCDFSTPGKPNKEM